MKKIVLIPVFIIATSVIINAQVRQVDKLPVISKSVKLLPLPTTPTLTEGKDLVISIDRFDDKSAMDLNKYTVYYTAQNAGTENVNLGAIQIKIQANFYTTSGNYVAAGGTAVLNTSGKSILYSGEIIKGSIDIASAHLNSNTTYKLSLIIDNSKHITEANENNNTAEVNITAHAIKNADYFVASARVTIQTGSDNKEANNSLLYFYLGPANYNQSSFFSLGNWSKGTGYAAEMKVNSSTDIVMNNSNAMGNPYNSLCFYKQKGVALTVIYNNKVWATDAWKINGITITLYFKDRNGNPYPDPAFASKTISFSNISNLLGFRPGDDIGSNQNQIRMLTIGTDQNFNPLPPEFEKIINNNFSTLVLRNSPTYNTPVTYCN